MAWGIPVIDTVVNKVGDYFIEGKKQKTLKIQQEGELNAKDHEVKVLLAEAKVEQAKNGQLQEYNLDAMTTENMSKSYFDEFMIILLLLPIVMSFIPTLAPIVASGFAALALMPSWYMYLVIGAYIVKLGMRGLFSKLLGSKFSIFKGK